jgi:hypothetical protein
MTADTPAEGTRGPLGGFFSLFPQATSPGSLRCGAAAVLRAARRSRWGLLSPER